MKKIKISLFAVLAIIIAMAASSFTTRSVHTNTEEWFSYDGGTMTVPGNYTYEGSEPPCEEGQSSLCAIKVLNDGSGSPDQSALNTLYNADNNHFAQPIEGSVDFKR